MVIRNMKASSVVGMGDMEYKFHSISICSIKTKAPSVGLMGSAPVF